ncbi:MAG: AraC family transcriptional regulator [Clostridiales Family XIII bacterium]|nr:AraC family transcriptional regulator [Clostridiales Family XIII bacterium]
MTQRTTLPIAEDGREQLDYANPSFPCVLIVADVSRMRNQEVPWHWHDDVEIGFVESGRTIFRVNDTSFVLNEGDGYFINRNVLHRQRLHESDHCELVTIIFSPGVFSDGTGSKLYLDLVLPLLADTDMDFCAFHADVPWEADVLACMRRILGYFRDRGDGLGVELRICGELAFFWQKLLANGPARDREARSLSMKNRKRIKSMISFIEKHYAEPLTLADIAEAGHVSPRECSRCFRAILGESPIGYLMKQRISEAAAMLLETNKNITEICYSVGFESLSYFSKTFRQHTGVTPKVYRKGG